MTYGMLRHGMLLALATAIALSASACGREGKNGSANPGSRANQSGAASPFGLNTQNNSNLDNNFSKFQNGADALKDRTGDGAARGTAVGGSDSAGRSAAIGGGTGAADSTRQDDGVSTSQDLANAVAAMDEVRSANVLVSGRTAFVAVVLHAGTTAGDNPAPGDVSDDLKNRIADKVKAANGSIGNVYVSSSPDFVSRVDAMRQDIAGGRPVAGFVRELYNMAERLFPTRSGSNNPVPPTP